MSNPDRSAKSARSRTDAAATSSAAAAADADPARRASRGASVRVVEAE